MIFFTIGGMPVIKRNMKTIEILFATGSDVCHKRLRRNTGFFSRDHDGRTMRIIGTHKVHFMATQSHETYPDIRLYVFHNVTDMEWPIGVRQSSGDEQLSGGCGAHC